jgi:hypothetical protein
MTAPAGCRLKFFPQGEMLKSENFSGILSTWNTVADLEMKRRAVLPYNLEMSRAIERKILRRMKLLATLLARDKA